MTDTCLLCHEQIDADDLAGPMGMIDADGAASMGWIHAECQMIGIIGHEFKVCSCTGYDTTSRAAAKELWRRVQAANLNKPHPEGTTGD